MNDENKKGQQTPEEAETVELSNEDLAQVTGGTGHVGAAPLAMFGKQDVTVSKAKTADKAFEAMDKYIRS